MSLSKKRAADEASLLANKLAAIADEYNNKTRWLSDNERVRLIAMIEKEARGNAECGYYECFIDLLHFKRDDDRCLYPFDEIPDEKLLKHAREELGLRIRFVHKEDQHGKTQEFGYKVNWGPMVRTGIMRLDD